MKRTTIILCALTLLGIACYAWARTTVVVVGQGAAAAPACADSSCAGFLVCQNFEEAGYDNSETWTTDAGSPNADYTATVLRGSQSLSLPNTAAIYKSITGGTEFYGHIMFTPTTVSPAANADIWKLWNSGFSSVAYLQLDTSNNLVLYNGADACWGTALTQNQTYHVWIYVKAGSGADGISQLWVSTTATKPGSTYASSTSGSWSSAVNAVYLLLKANQSMAWLIDQVLLSTSTIGDVCTP